MEKKGCSTTGQGEFLFSREVVWWNRRWEVNLAVLKMHVVGFDPRDPNVHTLSCTSNSCPCCGGVKALQMTSVNTNFSFRDLREWSLQLLILKELQMAFEGTGYSSDKLSFSWFAHFMSSGGIYEHRFCEQLEFGFCTSKIPVKFC